ncbi:hypothetical protein P152DRAFT_447676 [Eremomyces bilateralis CBS 781.70]|uniref:Uncharacterized protein n=1 Tax=Eremomyces bilateralis CBS 781.70 TaxID=1392243 RepID=A0A6G1G8P2_9PEZI|nr:uncharacterized protein P152DRAFT_447676 [Eremomyces bilateralis CBS 781.70]KAF1814291.1 hypothetical protein P152DRAFT_447676 [Eremomyces bilateralis CBS 781.70]
MVVTKQFIVTFIAVLGSIIAFYGRAPLWHASLSHGPSRGQIVSREAPLLFDDDTHNESSFEGHNISRLALALDWDSLRAKGAKQNCFYPMTIAELDKAQRWPNEPNFGYPRTSQSEFKEYGEMKRNGWTAEDILDRESAQISDPFRKKYDRPFQEFGISGDASAWQVVYTIHGEDVTIFKNGKTLQFSASYAESQVMINCADRALVVWSFDSPRGMGKEPPPLGLMSDVMFLEYKRVCLDRGHNQPLKTVIIDSVINRPTIDVLEKILGSSNEPTPWPGLRHRYDDANPDNKEKFLVLQGVPVSMVWGWFLNQHKEQLGLRRISAITIFGLQGEIHILYRMEDADSGPQCSFTPSGSGSGGRRLRPRQNSPTEFLDAVERGQNLEALFSKSNDQLNKGCRWPEDPAFGDATGAQSPFSDPNDLFKYGWNVRESTGDKRFLDIVDKYVPIVSDLGLSARLTAPPWEGSNIKQDAPAKVKSKDGSDEILFQPTGASWRATHNVDIGVLIISNVYTTEFVTRGTREGRAMVPLREKYDLAFLEWERAIQYRKKETRSLAYIFDAGIKTATTKNITQQCLKSVGRNEFPPWPGSGFWPENEARPTTLEQCEESVRETY